MAQKGLRRMSSQDTCFVYCSISHPTLHDPNGNTQGEVQIPTISGSARSLSVDALRSWKSRRKSGIAVQSLSSPALHTLSRSCSSGSPQFDKGNRLPHEETRAASCQKTHSHGQLRSHGFQSWVSIDMNSE